MTGRTLRVILTHDVDWPPHGPGMEHVMARKDRFEPSVITKVKNDGFNPYNNIGPLMDLERSLGLRSTFFFRPSYDDGTPVSAYSAEMRRLVAGGWEVGAHLNDALSLEGIRREKGLVGDASGAPPMGCRAHYLRIGPQSHRLMGRAGFAYDSSVMTGKEEVSPRNAGFIVEGGIHVFPITIMDAYLFTYMGVPEEKVPGVFESAIAACRDRGFMTVLWHDNSILMQGGRAYPRVCRLLASREDVECVTAADAVRLLTSGARR